MAAPVQSSVENPHFKQTNNNRNPTSSPGEEKFHEITNKTRALIAASSFSGGSQSQVSQPQQSRKKGKPNAFTATAYPSSAASTSALAASSSDNATANFSPSLSSYNSEPSPAALASLSAGVILDPSEPELMSISTATSTDLVAFSLSQTLAPLPLSPPSPTHSSLIKPAALTPREWEEVKLAERALENRLNSFELIRIKAMRHIEAHKSQHIIDINTFTKNYTDHFTNLKNDFTCFCQNPQHLANRVRTTLEKIKTTELKLAAGLRQNFSDDSSKLKFKLSTDIELQNLVDRKDSIEVAWKDLVTRASQAAQVLNTFKQKIDGTWLCYTIVTSPYNDTLLQSPPKEATS